VSRVSARVDGIGGARLEMHGGTCNTEERGGKEKGEGGRSIGVLEYWSIGEEEYLLNRVQYISKTERQRLEEGGQERIEKREGG